MSTFLCTGNAGFIGSHLTEKLLSLGHSVIGIDNFENGLKENMSNFTNNKNFSFYEKDLSDVDVMNDLIAVFGYKKIKIDGVFHVAAKARIQESIKNPSRTFMCNVNATFNVIELCRSLEIKNLVYSASSSAYGNSEKINHIDDKTDCLNPYSVSKYTGELFIKTWSKCYGLNAISLRYFNVYGARSQLSGPYAPIIGIFFRQKLQEKIPLTVVGTGTQKRDMTYVSDIVNANVLAMSKCHLYPGQVFNVGTGKNYSINEIAEMIGGETINIPPRPAESMATLADIELTKKCLEWEPTVSLEDGIEIMRKYYGELFEKCQ